METITITLKEYESLLECADMLEYALDNVPSLDEMLAEAFNGED